MNQTNILSAKEASELLGVHVNTIRTMVEDGRLVGFKTGGEKGHWRFEEEEVLKLKGEAVDDDSPEGILKRADFILEHLPSKFENNYIWGLVQEYFGIKNIFGAVAIPANPSEYYDIINKKAFVWVGTGAALAMMEYDKGNANTKQKVKSLLMKLDFAFGVIKQRNLLGAYTYTATPLLVVKGKDMEWVVSGTLQQFYPNLDKGLVVQTLEDAKKLYLNFEVYNREEFSEKFDNDYFIEKLEQEAKLKDEQ